MRRSEFTVLSDDVLGRSRAESVVADLVLSALGDRTAASAMDDGVDPGAAWTALCDALDVPERQRWSALDEERRPQG